jgi:hypothetical protein
MLLKGQFFSFTSTKKLAQNNFFKKICLFLFRSKLKKKKLQQLKHKICFTDFYIKFKKRYCMFFLLKIQLFPTIFSKNSKWPINQNGEFNYKIFEIRVSESSGFQSSPSPSLKYQRLAEPEPSPSTCKKIENHFILLFLFKFNVFSLQKMDSKVLIIFFLWLFHFFLLLHNII